MSKRKRKKNEEKKLNKLDKENLKKIYEYILQVDSLKVFKAFWNSAPHFHWVHYIEAGPQSESSILSVWNCESMRPLQRQ